MSTALDQLLSRHPDRVWRGRQGKAETARISTGYPALDEAIGGGWPTGTLVEILAAGPGLGGASLLLPALASLARDGRSVAWLPERYEQPYPPALMQGGIELSRVLVMVAEGQERLWAAEQSLHSCACGAVVLSEQSGRRIDDTALRRLKLAAAASGSLAFLLRGEGAARQPSPASLRIRVRGEPYTARRYLSILKCGSHPPRGLTLDLDAAGH
jgi:hypothetical protein